MPAENENPQKLTTIDTLGEFGLIEHLTGPFAAAQPSTAKAVGDDAAVLQFGNESVLVSTDMYVENVHFDLVYTPLMHLGYKCITGSISDIYAMNGEATQVLVSMALSSRYTIEALDELYAGMRIACKNYGVDLVGGDTTSSKTGLVINVTAIGKAKAADIAYRNGAKQGDLLCVTGDLGGAYVGLQVLEREKRVFLEAPGAQPELSGFDYVLKRQLRPEARKDVVEILQTLGVKPTAMIDISDGLASEIMHICRQSGTGCILEEENIPIDENTYHTALDFQLDPTVCALSGGEDYELLFTISPEDAKKLKNQPDFTLIGEITAKEEGCRLLTKSGNFHELTAQGWKHF